MFMGTHGLMGQAGYAIIEVALTLTDPTSVLHQSDASDVALEASSGKPLCNIYRDDLGCEPCI